MSDVDGHRQPGGLGLVGAAFWTHRLKSHNLAGNAQHNVQGGQIFQ